MMKCLWHRIKNFMLILIIAEFCLPPAGKALAANLEMNDRSGAAGSQVTFIVSVKGAPNAVTSLGADIVYNQQILEFKGCDFLGSLMEGWAFKDVTSPAIGVLRLGGFDLTGLAAGVSGDLVNITFKVIDPENCPLTLERLVDDFEGWSVRNGSFISDSPKFPAVTTQAIDSVTSTSAASGGIVSSDGGSPVSARGVCWGGSANPTIVDNHTKNGGGTGVFVSSINGLTANTFYHVRAYATNSVGTSYGENRTFTTSPVLSFPTPDIKINGVDGPLTMLSGTPLSVTITLDPGDRIGQRADWWVTAFTPFGWYSYIYPDGWVNGIRLCLQFELIGIPVPFEVLNLTLPPGQYRFAFAIDENTDGISDATWWDFADLYID